jgi:hypothetical protein
MKIKERKKVGTSELFWTWASAFRPRRGHVRVHAYGFCFLSFPFFKFVFPFFQYNVSIFCSFFETMCFSIGYRGYVFATNSNLRYASQDLYFILVFFFVETQVRSLLHASVKTCTALPVLRERTCVCCQFMEIWLACCSDVLSQQDVYSAVLTRRKRVCVT